MSGNPPHAFNFMVLCSIFPESCVLADGSCTIDVGSGVDVLVKSVGEDASMSVSSSAWSKKEALARNAEFTSQHCPDGEVVRDPVDAVLWCKSKWGAPDRSSASAITAGPSPCGESVGVCASDCNAGGAVSCELRRWLGFIGFYTPSIRRAFVEEARRAGLTGFLMPGKPAVAALEGGRAEIDGFITLTRTVLFASVPPASRKMSIMLDEVGGAAGSALLRRSFSTFEEVEMRCEPGTHARGDTADLGALRTLLDSRGLGHIALTALIP